MFIVTKEIDSENIGKLCRTCLREDGEKMVCLFVGPAGSSLAAKLRSLSCLEVWQGDGLPERMCDRCVTRAESALLYREQCRAADRALRQAAVKVPAALTPYTTISGCKLYQQNQGLIPMRNSRKTSSETECRTIFVDHQELYPAARLHVPRLQDATPVQHMHIVEPQNSYSTVTSLSTDLANGNRVERSMPADIDIPSRAACALHCPLCNRTFTNRTQLICHNFAHSTDNREISSPADDTEDIEVSGDSNQRAQNLSYKTVGHSTKNSIEDVPFSGASVQNDTVGQTLSLAKTRSISQSLVFPKIAEPDDAGQSNASSKPRVASRSERHQCIECPKTFSQKSKLLTHQLSHTGQRPYKCSDCERAYTSKSKLTAHMRLHTRINAHECTVCAKTFAYASYLEAHMKTHSSKADRPSFDCAVCAKKFCLSKNLKAHLRLHTGRGLLRCELCDKRFSGKYNLKVHLLSHRDAKVHKCEFCEKSFTQKGNLVEHRRIHTNVKPFECSLCHKRFSQSSHLKSHKVSHTAERQHQCRLCGKCFKLPSHLRRHLALHGAGGKAHECGQCGQTFSRAFSLKRHLRRHTETNNT